MNETKEKIENFVDDTIKRNDFEILDILWNFSYSIPSKTGYHNNKEAFKEWFGKICVRSLQKKYNLNLLETKEKMRVFVDFLNSMPDFLSYETFDEDDEILREILINKSSKILVQNIKNKTQDLSNLNKNIFSFVLNYIPIRIQDSIKEAEKIKQEYPSNESKYSFLPDFHIRTNIETGYIDYFEINPKEWTYIFNQLFDEELKEHKFKMKTYRKNSGFISVPLKQYDEYSFWQFGDELVNIGIGYWTSSISAKGNVYIEFIIPNFIYEDIKNYKVHPPIIENFIEKINEIKKEKENKLEKSWAIDEIINEKNELDNDIPEEVIEKHLISHLEILEEDLELIDNQYRTPVGIIDILCKDKNGNFVVVELKRGTGSHKAVGQIQNYIAWVNENLAEDKQVRGIIVVKESDKALEYAIRGSKFPIKIQRFGLVVPTEKNIIYCINCKKSLPKSAKFCSKCGHDVWM